MNDRLFAAPVFVMTGIQLVQEIACLSDAVEFLDDWPLNRRGAIYETALRACRRANDGHIPVNAARDAFVGFAKSANILEDPQTIQPWMVNTGPGRGGVAV